MARRGDKDQAGGGGDRDMSRASIQAGVQAALALCATCDHVRGASHPNDGPCIETWIFDGSPRHCECQEFWPIKVEYVDGLLVMGHGLAIGGSGGLELDRREAQELWDRLLAGKRVRLELELSVEGKGHKLRRVKGFIVGVDETRKLTATRLILPWAQQLVDPETGELQ